MRDYLADSSWICDLNEQFLLSAKSIKKAVKKLSLVITKILFFVFSLNNVYAKGLVSIGIRYMAKGGM